MSAVSDMDVLQHTEPEPGRDLFKTFRKDKNGNSNYATVAPKRRMSISTQEIKERQKQERKQAVKDYFLGLFPPLEWVPLYFASARKPKNSDIESQQITVKRRVPNAFPYDDWKKLLRYDLLAGIQVALMVVPQGMAYATLASLPPVMGLYSTLMGMLVYSFFGTSRELSVAPVAVNALLITSTLSNFADPVTQPELYFQYVLVTTFLVGVFSLGFGLLNLGYAVTFVSPAVITGFTSGSALTILVSQLETLFGFSTEKSDYALVTLYRFFAGLPKTKWVALLIGLISLAIMEGLKRIKKARLVPRPLLVVIISTVMAYLFQRFAPQFPLPIVGTVPRGLPPISVPQLTNSTMMMNAVVPAFLLTIIGFLQSIAVTLRFSEKRGYTVRPSQELNALGLAHIVGSFFSCFDVTGGFSRTAVSASVGTVSQFSSLVTTLGVLLSVLVLTPLFYYMPKSALAAIIISAVIPLIDPDAYKRLWKIGQRIDFWVAVGTALVTFGVTAQIGIGVGVGVSLIGILYSISRPHSTVMGRIVVPKIGEPEVGVEEEEADELLPMEPASAAMVLSVPAEISEIALEPGSDVILPEEVEKEALEHEAVAAEASEAHAENAVAAVTSEARQPIVNATEMVEIDTSKATSIVPITTIKDGTLSRTTGAPSVWIWRNVNRYRTQQIPGILIFRFDAQIWFANAVYFRERCMRIVQQPRDFGYRVDEAPPAILEKLPNVEANNAESLGAGLVPMPTASDANADKASAGTVDTEPHTIHVCESELDTAAAVHNSNEVSTPAVLDLNGDSAASARAGNAPRPTADATRIRYLIIDFTPVNSIDDAGFQALITLKSNLKDTCDTDLLLAGVKGPIRDVIWRSTNGFTAKDSLSKDMFFRDIDAAVEYAEKQMATQV